MLSILIQDATGGTTDILTLLLPLMLCCMLPSLFQRGGGSQQEPQKAEFDSWYISSGIQGAYDTVVKEVDGWRENSLSRKKSMFSFLSRKKPKNFVVTNTVAPRLLRVNDDKVGPITFELTDMDGGNTSIKATYDAAARTLIQNFKAKIPIKVALSTPVSVAAPKVCPSCGKEMLSDYKVCPFCETKLR